VPSDPPRDARNAAPSGKTPNLRVLEIEEIKSVPYTPVSHPFVERLIGMNPA
jgi:hypothetical protein